MGPITTVAEQHATLDTANVVGPLFVANMLNWALFGILAIQTYLFVLARTRATQHLPRTHFLKPRTRSLSIPLQFPRAHDHENHDRQALTQRSASSSNNMTSTSAYPSPVDRLPPPLPMPKGSALSAYANRQNQTLTLVVFFLFALIGLQVVLATTHAFHFFADRWGDFKRLKSSQQSWLLITAVNIIGPIGESPMRFHNASL